jgi:hypothetical protein|tara:strand:+ start:49512 stop:51038 length:1527 start_codon:yes stop_codon:yes gene_type:complete
MYRILTASKDTYITNKIINNSFRATDANLGSAGTLDLFKLYDENTIGSETKPIELSRLLIKFPISEIAKMDTDGVLDITDSSFKCTVKLHDVYGGQTTPSNFKAILFPLAIDFDEGPGMDVVNYSDVSSSNFITASITNGSAVKWSKPGAMSSGSLGASNIDVYTSGSLSLTTGPTNVSLSPVQTFETGREDLIIDVTRIVSGTVSGQIPDKGFLIALSGSYEKNEFSYFVKRFASRDVQVAALRPKLTISFDDSMTDRHSDFIFNVSSSLYLRNFQYGTLANIVSNTAGATLSGKDCMVVKLESGSFKETYKVSQVLNGRHRQTGVYSASFAVSSFDSILSEQANLTGSITFNEVWTNTAETITFLSSSLTIKRANRSITNTQNQNNLLVTVLNVNDEYRAGEIVNVRVFAEDRDRPVSFVRTPYEKKSQIFAEMYYRVRDVVDGKIIIAFDKSNNSTKLSTDSDGMFFDFYTDSLPRGRMYAFDFLIRRNGKDTVIKDAASNFKVI